MGSMERSFTDQSTLQEDERMALSFMDANTCGTRSKTTHSDLLVSFTERDTDRCVHSKVGLDIDLLHMSSQTEMLSCLHEIHYEDITPLTNLIKVTHVIHIVFRVCQHAARRYVMGHTSVCHPKPNTSQK